MRETLYAPVETGVAQLARWPLRAREVEEHLLERRLGDGVVLDPEPLPDGLHGTEDPRPGQGGLIHLVRHLQGKERRIKG